MITRPCGATGGSVWAELRTGDGRALPPCLRREIEREFLRLGTRAGADRRRRSRARHRRGGAGRQMMPTQPKVALLAKLGGIGTELV